MNKSNLISTSLSSTSSLTTLYEPLLDMIRLEPDWRLEVEAVDEAAELLLELNWDLISSENELLRSIGSTCVMSWYLESIDLVTPSCYMRYIVRGINWPA